MQYYTTPLCDKQCGMWSYDMSYEDEQVEVGMPCHINKLAYTRSMFTKNCCAEASLLQQELGLEDRSGS